MLNHREPYSVLPARDLARARAFYRDVLGMEPEEEREFGLVYRAPSGAVILLYETDNAGTAQNTAMGWFTDDLDADMTSLRARGVTFADYDLPGLSTENGVVTSSEDRAAWFTDSEGNILCVSQDLRVRDAQADIDRDHKRAGSVTD